MGKRELFLILGFIAVGVLVYRVSAPDSPDSTSRFSVRQILDTLRSELRGQNHRIEVKRAATTAVADGVTSIAIKEFRGSITVIGSERADAAVEIDTEVFGADEADARRLGGQVRVALQASGASLDVAVERPPSRRRPRSTLRVLVPRRLAVVIDAVGRIEVAEVAGVTLDSRLGDVTMRQIAGQVRGQHRDGDLTVTAAEGVEVAVRRGAVRLENIGPGGLDGEFLDGRAVVRDVKGKTVLETRRAELEIERSAGELSLDATDGSVRVRQPAGPVRFEGRRSRLTFEADPAVALQATSSEAPVELALPGTGATLDLVAEGARVQLPAGLLEVTTTGGREAAAGRVGESRASWRVRTTRADIIVRR